MISVVIPALNAGKSLKELIEEVERQDGPPREIIVVDDGSLDDTTTVAIAAGVHCIRQDNQGPAVARNNGAAQASGDILLFLDSDLVPGEKFVERIIAPFSDPSIDAVQGTMKTRQRLLVPRYCQAEIEYKQQRCRREKFVDSISAGIFAIRREVFREYNGFCSTFRMAAAEDTDLSFRMAEDGRRILFLAEAFAYHPQPDTLAAYVRLKFWRGYWRALLYRRHPTKVLRDSYTSQCQKIQVAGACSAPLWIGLLYWLCGIPAIIACLAALSLTTLPATLGVAKQAGIRVAIITPLMQLMASCSLAIGLIAGSILEVFAAPAPKKRSEMKGENHADASVGD